MDVSLRGALPPQWRFVSVTAIASLFFLVPPCVHAANPHPAPVSLPLSYYEERGLIPARLAPVSAPSAGRAVLPAAATGYRTTSATVTLTQPANYTVDLASQTRVVNRSIRLTNTGTVDVRNPWVVANGTRDWYDSTRIMKEAVGTETVPDLKAFRLWQFMRASRYHWVPAEADMELHSPVKYLNVYGCGFCDDSATNLEVPAAPRGFHRCALLGHPGACDPRGQL